MRIIGGDLKGRKWNPPIKKWPTRPTMDHAREAIFNILSNQIDFEGSKVLDLFGGTASMSFEFVSRGSTDVVMVDKHYSCISYAKRTSSEWGIDKDMRFIKSDVLRYIKNCQESFDLIFADPPYDYPYYTKLPELVFTNELLREENSLLIIEHDKRIDFKKAPFFNFFRQYGDSFFSFFSILR